MRGFFAIAAETAGRQHGRITHAQLLAAGVDGGGSCEARPLHRRPSRRSHTDADQGSSSTARRRRSDHVAYAKGDVFERGAETIADLRRRLRQAAR